MDTAWAACLGESDARVARRGTGSLGLSPDDAHGTIVAVAILPPGARAAALGRSALIPHTEDFREAGLGPVHALNVRIPAWCAEIVHWHGRMGLLPEPHLPNALDLPVVLDPATGRAHDVLHDALVQEWWPWRDIGVWLWRHDQATLGPARSALRLPGMAARLLRSVPGGVRELVGDIRSIGDAGTPPDGERPDDDSHPPVEGVGYRTWVVTSALLERDEVHPAHREQFTAHRGVPPGRWDAVDAAWRAWAAQDAHLGAWATYDRERLLPLGARW